jgi:small-conductance mechanosensitive channel
MRLDMALSLPGRSVSLPGPWKPRAASLFDLLSDHVRTVLQWPLFRLGSMDITALFIGKCIIFVVVLWFVARLLARFLDRRLLALTSIDHGERFAVARMTRYIIFSIGILVGLDSSGLNLRSLLVVGGTLGIGVGFGLQSVFANFISGVVILMERPIKLGDVVEVGGTLGEVLRIGARSTWIRTGENQIIIVPNSEFVNSRVTNWTANDRSVRFSMNIGISYNSDVSQAQQILVDTARHHAGVLQDPIPEALITDFAAGSIILQLRVWATIPPTWPHRLKSGLYLEILRAFNEHGIEMPNPQRDLNVRSMPPIVLAGAPPLPPDAEPAKAPASRASI